MLGAATRAVAMRSKDREGKAVKRKAFFHDKRKHPHSPVQRRNADAEK
jgi:hypothetical protein